MFKVLVPAFALLGFVAVAARPAAPAVEVQADPAPMGWHLHHEGSLAKLAYGVANSDQLVLMVSCRPGDRHATLYGDVHPDTPRLMAVSRAAGPDPLTGGEAYEARVPLTDPVLQGLASRGRMPVEGVAGARVLRADQNEQQMIGQFMSYCAGATA